MRHLLDAADRSSSCHSYEVEASRICETHYMQQRSSCTLASFGPCTFCNLAQPSSMAARNREIGLSLIEHHASCLSRNIGEPTPNALAKGQRTLL